jgi:hypothetical protein
LRAFLDGDALVRNHHAPHVGQRRERDEARSCSLSGDNSKLLIATRPTRDFPAPTAVSIMGARR